MTDQLWAPWRINYIKGLEQGDSEQGCFLCNALNATDAAKHLILGKGEKSFVIMNRYPYNPGHLMIVSRMHVGNIEELEAECQTEIWQLLIICKQVLTECMNPQGFNIGINQGKCAGAGLVEHLHLHIVPRWSGDSNFMSVTGETRVISQSLTELYQDLRPLFSKHRITV